MREYIFRKKISYSSPIDGFLKLSALKIKPLKLLVRSMNLLLFRVEEYVRSTFAGTNVKIEVIQGQETFEKEYPCLAAVNRAASVIPRHDGRVIWLTYEPEGTVDRTLIMVGKGITYDTGGADIKAGGKIVVLNRHFRMQSHVPFYPGIMAGMSRDKCGAASVAGVLKSISELKPKNVKVIGALAMVRNSVGENCYVADEIITSRAGVRIRVGNTDAEVGTRNKCHH